MKVINGKTFSLRLSVVARASTVIDPAWANLSGAHHPTICPQPTNPS